MFLSLFFLLVIYCFNPSKFDEESTPYPLWLSSWHLVNTHNDLNIQSGRQIMRIKNRYISCMSSCVYVIIMQNWQIKYVANILLK